MEYETTYEDLFETITKAQSELGEVDGPYEFDIEGAIADLYKVYNEKASADMGNQTRYMQDFITEVHKLRKFHNRIEANIAEAANRADHDTLLEKPVADLMDMIYELRDEVNHLQHNIDISRAEAADSKATAKGYCAKIDRLESDIADLKILLEASVSEGLKYKSRYNDAVVAAGFTVGFFESGAISHEELIDAITEIAD